MRLISAVGSLAGASVFGVGAGLLVAATYDSVTWALNGSEMFHDTAALFLLGLCIAAVGGYTVFAAYEFDRQS